ncbi:cyclin-like protein [Tribonema minus]|uniref:Cyclin-like protein n=1 Tax=Tribonema minus TaxID=303371 RepID=A0A836CN34_9STRA|nr:cyclin-like protein [Tribonema minus]
MYAPRKGTGISPSRRCGLFDWIMAARKRLMLEPSTLHMAFSIADRFCAVDRVDDTELRLFGAAALMIACKYEETVVHSVRTYVYICDMSYHKLELIDMERRILERLEYRLTVPTTYTFMAYAMRDTSGTPAQLKRARRYAESALRDHRTLAHLPSEIAAAAIYLSRAQDVGHVQAQKTALNGMCSVSHVALARSVNHMIKVLAGAKVDRDSQCAPVTSDHFHPLLVAAC